MVMIEACLASELPPGTMNNVILMGRTILLANVEGKLFAMDGLCSSDGGNLSDGRLQGFHVKCPIHGSEFDLRTGKVVEQAWGGPKKTEDLRVYTVVREGDCILVDI